MEKKRIIVTAAQVPFVSGGAEIHVGNLVKELRLAGHEAELVQLPYRWYPEASLYDSMLAWRLLDLSESNGKKIDLVIGTKFPSYGARHDNKVVWVIHQLRQVYDLYETEYGYKSQRNGDIIKKKVEQFDRVCLSESRYVFGNSQNVSNRMLRYNGISSEPLYHPPTLSGKYKTEGFEDYIFTVGRLDKIKRNELLLQTLPYLDKHIKIMIGGNGPEMEPLKNLIRKYKAEDRVKLLGFVEDEDLLNYYANAFAVYYAPIDEDYGYVTLEAFLSKKPVITCEDSGGVLEFVKDGESGYVCKTEAEALADKINLLYKDKKAAERLGMEGYQRVKDITWKNVIEKLTRTL